MKGKFLLFSLIIFSLFVSCGSGPETIPAQDVVIEPARPVEVVQPPPVIVVEPVIEPVTEPVDYFDPTTVTQEQYDSTMDEVRLFIEQLNQIIRSRNYDAWVEALLPEHFEELSSPENLQHFSESPAMRTRRITLTTAQDYFTHVVVPSRANSRVDEIEFVGRDRVKVYTISISRTGEEQRLRLFDLEKIGNTWKIIN
jgi:hypothetical protein